MGPANSKLLYPPRSEVPADLFKITWAAVLQFPLEETHCLHSVVKPLPAQNSSKEGSPEPSLFHYDKQRIVDNEKIKSDPSAPSFS